MSISEFLASRTDTELATLLASGSAAVGVGGATAVVDVAGLPVFAKQIPLTDLELANPRSTANLFDVPAFCQYGIVTPGYNAWRELAANELLTTAVLAGHTRAFPVLHHWRVLPGRPPIAAEYADIDTVVAALDNSPAARARFTALAAASSSLVLVNEYVPHPLTTFLDSAPPATVERQFFEITTFLASRRLLHMDGHFGNMRTDGEQLYLTDFGLVTSPDFDLNPDERAFVDRNATHDAGYAAMRLVNWLVTAEWGVPAGGVAPRNEYVLRCASGDIPATVPPDVVPILRRHAPVAARMNAFYWRLFDGEVHAEYPA